ncbi:unnamed protein product [Sphagnum troendelagicum]
MEQFRDRVKEVANIVAAVREGATASMINGKQCGTLASLYDRIDDYLKKLVEMDAANDVRLLPLLDEIIRVLERGKVLVLQYGSAQWFELAVTRGDNREAFKEIHLLLETSMKTLRNHISQDLPVSSLWSFFWHISSAKQEMRAIAEEDHDKILETLQMFNENFPTAIAKLKGTGMEQFRDRMFNLPINMKIDLREVKCGKKIGGGAYGLVREACWLGCNFAVKIIRTKDINALKKEVEILAKLSHPHIVQLVGFSEGYPTSMILMELMDGDLRHLIKDRVKSTPQAPPFPPEVAMDIISQIAAGMAYLHKQGVFHGDLKASNVLVNNRGGRIEAKIADFGVSQTVQLTKCFDTSKHSDGDIASGTSVYSHLSFSGVVGTTGWRAPEVSHIQTKEGETSSVKPTYTGKADVFSFAMTCYEVLSGKLYSSDLPRQSVNELIRKGVRPELPEDINPRLSSLIQKCWQTEARKRPTFEKICFDLQEMKAMETKAQERQKFQEMKALETKAQESQKFQEIEALETKAQESQKSRCIRCIIC